MRFVPILVLVLLVGAPVPAASAQDAWRVAAQERIEQYRKGTIRVMVRDDAGSPVANAPVDVRMKRHAFGFGTAVSTGMLSNSHVPVYREKVANLTGDGRTFNLAVFGNAMKWPQWEASTNRSVLRNQILWLNSRGMDVRGHNLLWPGSQWLPQDISASNDAAYISNRLEEHIYDIAGHTGIKGRIREWDVVNEPRHLTYLRDKLKGQSGYPTGEEIYSQAFAWAAEADPGARLFVNEYNIIANYSSASWHQQTRAEYRGIIQRLIDAGAPLHGIGMQAHMGSTQVPPASVYAALEEFAAFGKALAVTEYDAEAMPEESAGDYMRDFLTVVFSHPLVESFTMWGFWDGDHWKNDAPIFRHDWSMKPSGEAFIDLVFNEWWTDESVVTDEQGLAIVDAFLGDYEISTVLHGEPFVRNASLTSSDTTSITLSRTGVSAQRDDALPRTIALHQNYPNPFNPSTVLTFELPERSFVTLRVFNVLGQEVRTLVEGMRSPGVHAMVFEAHDLPSGLYIYRLQTRSGARTRQMLLLR